MEKFEGSRSRRKGSERQFKTDELKRRGKPVLKFHARYNFCFPVSAQTVKRDQVGLRQFAKSSSACFGKVSTCPIYRKFDATPTVPSPDSTVEAAVRKSCKREGNCCTNCGGRYTPLAQAGGLHSPYPRNPFRAGER